MASSISQLDKADATEQIKKAVDQYNNSQNYPKLPYKHFVIMMTHQPLLDTGKFCDVLLLDHFIGPDGIILRTVYNFIDFYHNVPGKDIVVPETHYDPKSDDYYNVIYRRPEMLQLVKERCFKDGKLLEEYAHEGAVVDLITCELPLHPQLLEQISRSLDVERIAKGKQIQTRYHVLCISDNLETVSQRIDNLLNTGRMDRKLRKFHIRDTGEPGANNISILRRDLFRSPSRIYVGGGNWELYVRD